MAPKKIAVIDSETDPARPGRLIRPFAWGFYDGSIYQTFWGDDCTDQLVKFLEEYDEPLTIFAHNGGKFDYKFLLRHFDDSLKVIGARIVRGYLGKHEMRDSYANIPVPLADFHTTGGTKLKFKYEWMEREHRERYKKQIVEYLKQDCIVLYEGIEAWLNLLGNKLTMASAAMNELNKVTTNGNGKAYKRLSAATDAELRPFYYGGRVECFAKGLIVGDRSIYDFNSMYPYVMANYRHPTGNYYHVKNGGELDACDFAVVTGNSRGALPVRGDSGGLHFPHSYGTYFASVHEINSGIKTGRLTVDKVEKTYRCSEHTTFNKFVDRFYDLRLKAKASGNKMLTLFYKLVMNSAYGKFGQNPDRYKEYRITHVFDGENLCACGKEHAFSKDSCPDGWNFSAFNDGITVWERPSRAKEQMLLNVATAASITAAARAMLLEGMEASTDVIYCDTDSIVCKSTGAYVDPNRLGALKFEASGDMFALAGKKMYALFGEKSDDERETKKRIELYGDATCIKLAAKGVRLKASEIIHLAKGQTTGSGILLPDYEIREGTMSRDDKGITEYLSEGRIAFTQSFPQFNMAGLQNARPLRRIVKATA